MSEPKYLTNKEAITLIKERVEDEPTYDTNIELIRFILNTISKVVNT